MSWLILAIISIILSFYFVIYSKIIKNDLEEVEEDFKEVDEDFKEDFKEVEEDFKEDFKEVDEDFKEDFKEVEEDFKEVEEDFKEVDSKDLLNKSKKIGDQHGLNPFNDPYFRAYLKDYANLSKEKNRKLVAEFILNPFKAKILEWLCFDSYYVIPADVYPNRAGSNCDLSTISEFSHCHSNKQQYHHCFCQHNNTPPEKYLGRYHSDGILEKLNHQCRTELESTDENLLTHSLISLYYGSEPEPKLLRRKSSSLNDIIQMNDNDNNTSLHADDERFLCDLIKEQQKELEMKVYPDQKDTQRVLIGAVGDNVIYLSISQINLFHYLIENQILQYIKKSWNSVHEFYQSNHND
jgi:uncharacterized protein YoxC